MKRETRTLLFEASILCDGMALGLERIEDSHEIAVIRKMLKETDELLAKAEGDLLPVDAPVLRLVSVREGWRNGDEAEPVYGRSDHRDFERA